MKHIILILTILFVGCSKEPKEMDKVLFDRSGQWITNDDYSSFFFSTAKCTMDRHSTGIDLAKNVRREC